MDQSSFQNRLSAVFAALVVAVALFWQETTPALP
jgi:hypothetical protein